MEEVKKNKYLDFDISNKGGITNILKN